MFFFTLIADLVFFIAITCRESS